MDISHSLYIPFIDFYPDDLSACSSCLFGPSLLHCRDAICRWTNTLCLLITMVDSLLLFDSRSSSHDCMLVTMHSWCCVSVCNACSAVRESQRYVPCGAGARPTNTMWPSRRIHSLSVTRVAAGSSRSHKIASLSEPPSRQFFNIYLCLLQVQPRRLKWPSLVEDSSPRFLSPSLYHPHPLLSRTLLVCAARKMSSVIRFFSLALAALALLGISTVDAYAIPRASVDYRRHDVNVRIIEETRSIPSVASSPRYIALRREVRDFRVPRRLRTRQTLPRPPSGLADTPDVIPVLPMEEHGAASTSDSKVALRDVALPYTDALPTLLPRDGAGLIQLDLLNTYYQDMRRHSRNLRM